MIEIIKGDLLTSPEKYIAHQCNAVSNQAGGLAYHLFNKFSFADIYSSRPYPYRATKEGFPGHIVIKGDGQKDRFVINMIAQYYPGSPVSQASLLDNSKTREGYFYRCLLEISKIEKLESIAFPFGIGCGLAGGNWKNYLSMLTSFDIIANQLQNVRVVVYDNGL